MSQHVYTSKKRTTSLDTVDEMASPNRVCPFSEGSNNRLLVIIIMSNVFSYLRRRDMQKQLYMLPDHLR